MMDCHNVTWNCIDELHPTIVDKPFSNEMPSCSGIWREIPKTTGGDLPPGKYGLVFSGRVTAPGLTLTLTVDGKPFATVTYPHTRNWECVPDKPKLVS